MNDHAALKKESENFKSLLTINVISSQMIADSYLKIKKNIAEIIDIEINRMMNTPELEGLIVKK